jgi:hypothetical protein
VFAPVLQSIIEDVLLDSGPDSLSKNPGVAMGSMSKDIRLQTGQGAMRPLNEPQ